MSDPNFSAIRARLRYESVDEFIDNYGRFISRRGMFLPMAASKLKPVGTTVRFQLLLADGSSAMLGEGVVRKLKGLEDGSDDGPVGMLVKFSKLSSDSKQLVEQVVEQKSGAKPIPGATEASESDDTEAAARQRQEESEADTGVLGADEADQLLSETSAPADDEEPTSRPSDSGLGDRREESENQTREVELPVDEQTGEVTSGDEVFGDDPGPSGLGDDPSKAVAEALGEPTSEAVDESVEKPGAGQEPSEQPAPPPDTDGESAVDEAESLFGDDDDLFGQSQAEQRDAADDQNLFDDVGDDADDEWFGSPDDDEAVDDSRTASGDQEVSPSPEGESSAQDVEGPPEALAESEGGIKVMSYDDSELDEEATREFEQFATAGEEDEVDEMFDNIFGGGDEGDLFGGGDGDDGDFFGAGDDADAEAFDDVQAEADDAGGFGDDAFAQPPPESDDARTPMAGHADDGQMAGTPEAGEEVFDEQMAGTPEAGEEVFDEQMAGTPEAGEEFVEDETAGEDALFDQEAGQQESEAGLEVDSEFVVDERPSDDSGPPSAPEAGPETDSSSPPQIDAEPASEQPDEVAPQATDPRRSPSSPSEQDPSMAEEAEHRLEEDAPSVSIREHDGDSSEHIQSLLAMEDEPDQEEDLTLNIGGGSLEEESSEAEEQDDPDDSMEMFLASAKQEVENKKKKEQAEQQEEDDKDILDEVLGDDDLPPPAAGPSPLDMPDPEKKKKKKKKKGFISKFFGGDD